jgi:methyl-accepting chemotaxis protein
MSTPEPADPRTEASVFLDSVPEREVGRLLVDRRFQLRYTGMIAAICAALTAGLGSLIYYFLREASQVVAIRALDPADPDAAALRGELLRTDRWVLTTLVVFGVVLIIAIVTAGLRITRKVARPLVKISFHLNEIANGRLSPIGAPRPGDHLQDFIATFRRMYDSLEKRTRADAELLEEAGRELEGAGRAEAAASMRARAVEKRRFLGTQPT